MRTRQDRNPHAKLPFEVRQLFAVFVQQLQRSVGRRVHFDVIQVIALKQQITDPAHDRGGQRPRRAHHTDTTTHRTADHRGFKNRWTNALAGQFEQAERRNATQLDPRAIATHGFFEPALNLPTVLGFIHIDEVNHHQTRQIAQAQLTRDFFRRFEVGGQGGFFDGTLFGRLAGVHINRDQSLGLVHHQVSARLQRDHGIEQRIQLLFSLVSLEQRNAFVLMLLDALGIRRGQDAHKVLGVLVSLFTLNLHFFHVGGVHVANGALHHVCFFVNQRRRHRCQCIFANTVPCPAQVFIVALDFGLGALAASRPHDDRDILRQVQIVENCFQPTTVFGRGNLPRNAATARGVGHVDTVATRQRQVGRQRSTLVAALFLRHLDQHHLTALNDFLNLVPARNDGMHDGATLSVFVKDVILFFVVHIVIMIIVVVVVSIEVFYGVRIFVLIFFSRSFLFFPTTATGPTTATARLLCCAFFAFAFFVIVFVVTGFFARASFFDDVVFALNFFNAALRLCSARAGGFFFVVALAGFSSNLLWRDVFFFWRCFRIGEGVRFSRFIDFGRGCFFGLSRFGDHFVFFRAGRSRYRLGRLVIFARLLVSGIRFRHGNRGGVVVAVAVAVNNGLLRQGFIQAQGRSDAVGHRVVCCTASRHFDGRLVFNNWFRSSRFDFNTVGRQRLGLDEVPILINGKLNVRLVTIGINSINRRSNSPGGRRTAAGHRAAVLMPLSALLNLVFHLSQQRFAVGDRQLVVIGVNLRKRQEAMTVSAIVNKRSLQRRLNPRYTRQINVGFNRTAIRRFVVDFFDASIDHNHDPSFITAGRVDKHFLAHHIS